MLDYKLVSALAAVVEEGGFEKAGKRLNLSQSAISQRVRLLEEHIGQVLLSRSTPPVPSSAGHRLLKHYKQVVLLEADLLQDSGAPGAMRTLSVGVNADSIATWFLSAVTPFLLEENVLLDITTEDQAETHRLLRKGEVMGCISARAETMQGCRIEYLGRMDYRMVAAPDFAEFWFPDGLTQDVVQQAPAVMFNRKDDLHYDMFELLFGDRPSGIPTHYIPSSEKFARAIASGLGYGMLPEQQCADLLQWGGLVDIAPQTPVPVPLYWHRWNIDSPVLDGFTRALLAGAKNDLIP